MGQSVNDEDRTELNHELRITRCRYCHAQIIWFKTEDGKNVPIDADTVEPEDDTDEGLDLERHVSHFSTCPQSNQFRKPR